MRSHLSHLPHHKYILVTSGKQTLRAPMIKPKPTCTQHTLTLPSVHSANHTNITMTYAGRLSKQNKTRKKKQRTFKITKHYTKTTAAKWEG